MLAWNSCPSKASSVKKHLGQLSVNCNFHCYNYAIINHHCKTTKTPKLMLLKLLNTVITWFSRSWPPIPLGKQQKPNYRIKRLISYPREWSLQPKAFGYCPEWQHTQKSFSNCSFLTFHTLKETMSTKELKEKKKRQKGYSLKFSLLGTLFWQELLAWWNNL